MNLDDVYKFIDVNPFKGKESVFWGTKVRVSHILNDMSNGVGVDAILVQHPELSAEHIEAAKTFATHFPTDEERLLYIAASLLQRTD